MKNLYFIGCSDYVAADDENQACEMWSKITGESLGDYPNLEVELVERDEVIKVLTDGDEDADAIVKTAREWATETKHPEIVCSLNW